MKKDKRIKKQFWLGEYENKRFIEKVERTGLSQSAVMRALILGYEPREKPDERFYEVMKKMYEISDNLKQLERIAYIQGYIDKEKLTYELEKFNKFQLEVQMKFLRAEKNTLGW